MPLDAKQIELLEAIQRKLRQGDIKAVSEVVGFSKVYVSLVLSPNSQYYHEDIVQKAVEIIAAREQNTKNLLKKIA